MSIASVTGFVTAGLAAVGIALAILVLSVGAAVVQYFTENHRIRVSRQEPLVRYYRRQLALG